MLLKHLSELNGVSGNEKEVRDYIIEYIKDKVDSYKVDKIGNLLALKKSSSPSAPRVAISAHMDEVGLFITEVTPEGYLKFQNIGYIDPMILVSKPVIINNKILGVIGSKAIHLQKPEERKQSVQMEQLYIDIGAAGKEEVEEQVRPGSYAAFVTEFSDFGSGFYKGKALDDRAGCTIIMELLNKEYDCNLTAVFTVQEELGLRGSKVVSNNLEADLAIVVEATSALDIHEHEQERRIVELGKGPACSLMDAGTIYNPKLIRKTMEIAEENSIPIQYREGTQAANDAGSIHLSREGIPTITISIPCRYIHSMSSLISKDDYDNCIKLLGCILDRSKEFVALLSQSCEQEIMDQEVNKS